MPPISLFFLGPKMPPDTPHPQGQVKVPSSSRKPSVPSRPGFSFLCVPTQHPCGHWGSGVSEPSRPYPQGRVGVGGGTHNQAVD